MTNHPLLEEINKFCDSIGRDSLLVQGAGGNVSFKLDNELWIKASGTSLAEANHKNIFVPVDLNLIIEEINKNNFDFKPIILNSSKLKPSIETILHALMPQKIVVHLHAINILSYLVKKDLHKVHEKIACGSSVLVDYCKPGATLAQAVHSKLKDRDITNVVFLKNHGIVVGAESVEEINKILFDLSGFFKIEVKNNFDAIKPIQDDSDFKKLNYKQSNNLQINALATKTEFISRLKNDWALCPDHVVFLGEKAFIINDLKELQVLDKSDTMPPYIFYVNHGVFERVDINKTQEEQLICYSDILLRQSHDDILESLTTSQIKELIDWDAEKYRKKLQKND